MARYMLCPPNVGFADSRRATLRTGAAEMSSDVTNFADTASVNTMRNALIAFDPFTYTTEVLEQMTVNDMVFAWRACRGNQASISNYHPAQVARTS